LFPKDKYPELYEYRSVSDRLLAKLKRTYKNIPDLDFSKERKVYFRNALNYLEKQNIAIISSPPYMKSLTYARDNRLRLWFLGYSEWEELEKKISVGKQDFLTLMKKCFNKWYNIQNKGNYCILVIGDIEYDKIFKIMLPDVTCNEAAKEGYYIDEIRDYPISTDRKFDKKDSQIKMKKICIIEEKIVSFDASWQNTCPIYKGTKGTLMPAFHITPEVKKLLH